MKLKGGRPKKNNKVINVAKYMPQIKNVAKRQLIIGQLDQLKSIKRIDWDELIKDNLIRVE